MKRLVVILTAGLGFFVLSAAIAGTAWSAASTSTATIVFDDTAHQAELLIPTPPCSSTQPTCEWKFFLNEPKLSVDIATVYGTSGTLVIPYPKDFCGVIQADAYVGPPFVPKRGFQHVIDDCNQPPPDASNTGTTTATTANPAPPIAAPNSLPPPTVPEAPTASASADVPVTSTPPTSTVISPSAQSSAQLPFTGADYGPLWLTGLALLVLGWALNSSGSTWRRVFSRLFAATPIRTSVPKHRIQRER